MKKLNYSVLHFMAVIFAAVILTSCSKDNYSQLEYSSKLRDQLMVGKEYSKIQEDFDQLDRDAKVALWNEKLDQILSLNLPAENKKLTNEMKVELSKSEINVTKISDIAQNLAKITPEEDFEKMYATLYDYKYNEKFIGKEKISEDNLEQLKRFDYNYKSKSKITQKLTDETTPIDPLDPYACNCNWTCSWYGVKPTSNCKATRSGCGFLWSFECTKGVKNEPVPIPTPIKIERD